MSSAALDDVSASRSQRQSPWLSIPSSIAIAFAVHNFVIFRGSLLGNKVFIYARNGKSRPAIQVALRRNRVILYVHTNFD